MGGILSTIIIIVVSMVAGAAIGAFVMYLYVAGELRGWFDRLG